MPRALVSRRMPRPRPLPPHRRHGALLAPSRTSDLVLALLGVALLGGFALLAAYSLASGVAAP